MAEGKKTFKGGGDKEREKRARDSFHILPLSMIPLETPALKCANLVKNARLETAVELFNDPTAGSGQISPDKLPEVFQTYAEEIRRDQKIIQGLAQLDSFDVFSLRSTLRKMGLEINDEHLCLSEDGKAELSGYMQQFTRPLIEQVFGSGAANIKDMDDITRLYNNADRDIARKNITLMADKLDVPLAEVPNFLQEYSDIFISVAYYQKSFDELLPEAGRLLDWMQDIKKDREVSKNRGVINKCEHTEAALKLIVGSLRSRLDFFQRHFEKFWSGINADSFRLLKNVIAQNHADIGSVLCGLMLKITLWKEEFPTDTAAPNRRAEFVSAEIYPGIDHLRKLEEQARTRLARVKDVA